MRSTQNIILLGNSCSGKTSIVNKVLNTSSEGSCIITVGIDYHYIPELSCNLFDCAGQKRYNKLVSNYALNCDKYIIVFDLSDRESMIDIDKWLKIIKNHKYILIIGNKLDLVNRIPVEVINNYIDELQEKYYCKFIYIETSVIQDKGIDIVKGFIKSPPIVIKIKTY
jgi:small GTP-binding protein